MGANMKKLTIAVGLLCGLLATSAAHAQGRRPIPTPQGIFNPVVGTGAEYSYQTKNGTKGDFTISIVGKESSNGKDGYWMETSTVDPQMGEVVVKMLLVPEGNNGHVDKLIMQMPGRGPMEFDGMMGGRMAPTEPTKDIRDSATDVGSESVTVPAGTFTCEHYKAKDGSGDYWVAKNAGPYGLVKMQGQDQSSMTLTKVITDAKDKITGTPQPFDPSMMGGMGRGMGGGMGRGPQ